MTLSIAELGACAGHHRRLDIRLAEVTGTWAHDDRQATAAVLFGAHCPQFNAHAELWRERFPALQVPPIDECSHFDESLIHSVDTMAVATDTLERLVGMYQFVLPRLLVACSALRATIDSRIDGPTARVLDVVVRELAAMSEEGAALLERSR